MFSVAWLGQTIAVEYHKVVVDVLGKMLKVGKCLGVFVQVVKDKACKVFVIYVRCAKLIEGSAQGVGSKMVGVGTLVHYLHCTHAIIVSSAWF